MIKQQSKSSGSLSPVFGNTRDYADPPAFPVGDMSKSSLLAWVQDFSAWWATVRANIVELESEVSDIRTRANATTSSAIRASVSATSPLAYDSTTGVFSIDQTQEVESVNSKTGKVTLTTDDIPQGQNNLYASGSPGVAATSPFINRNHIMTRESVIIPDESNLVITGPFTVDGYFEVAGYFQTI